MRTFAFFHLNTCKWGCLGWNCTRFGSRVVGSWHFHCRHSIVFVLFCAVVRQFMLLLWVKLTEWWQNYVCWRVGLFEADLHFGDLHNGNGFLVSTPVTSVGQTICPNTASNTVAACVCYVICWHWFGSHANRSRGVSSCCSRQRLLQISLNYTGSV